MGASEMFKPTIDFLRRRRISYKLTFGTNRLARTLREAYRKVFLHYAGQAVLADLATFCRAHETCVVARRGQPVDIQRSLVLEGRREVWIRLQDHLNLNDSQLHAIYSGQQFPMTTEGEDDGR
jgi:hypothetical protein